MTTADTVRGRVEARNPNGIRVAGEWHNVSKFRPLELPAVGASVELGVNPKGFITSLEVLEPSSVGAKSEHPSRDETITRLAVLKAAAAFAAARDEAKSGDVLLIADRWLQWVQA